MDFESRLFELSRDHGKCSKAQKQNLKIMDFKNSGFQEFWILKIIRI
jgi:hypothetical protein